MVGSRFAEGDTVVHLVASVDLGIVVVLELLVVGIVVLVRYIVAGDSSKNIQERVEVEDDKRREVLVFHGME